MNITEESLTHLFKECHYERRYFVRAIRDRLPVTVELLFLVEVGHTYLTFYGNGLVRPISFTIRGLGVLSCNYLPNSLQHRVTYV